MPGISFISSFKGDLEQKKSQILQSLKSLLHNEQYKQEILIYDNSRFLGCTRYEKYPMFFFENDKFCIYLEGQIYGKDYTTINMELNNLAEFIFYNENNTINRIDQYLLNIDGDFIIMIFSKHSSEICIINDALGRLPLYYYNANGELIVSRELRFIKNLINDKQFDRMAIAQYLLFGYPLDNRTLLENIFYLKPATLLKININTSTISMGCYHQFNFENKKYTGVNYNEYIKNMVKLFTEACKNRSNSVDKNIVSLSGGLDSRSVAAGLHKEKISFFGTTFHDFYEIADSDVKIAEQLANIFDIEWKIFHLGPPKGKDILKLLRIKNGLNFLGMSYILPFFDMIKETYGNDIIYFTGDGGIVLKYLRPLIKLKDLDALIDYIIALNASLSLDNVAALTKVDKHEIISELKKLLTAYPEKDLYSKYVHFFIYDHCIKWAFEGEDRNRFYFWSVTPFYSIKFFDYAMNCPDEIKRNYGLYGDFLLELSPQALAIDYANLKLPITSNKFKLLSFFKMDLKNIYVKLPSKIQRFARNKRDKDFNLKVQRIARSKLAKDIELYENNSNVKNCILEQIDNCRSIQEYLSIQFIKKIILNNNRIDNLFTITSIIEEFESSESTLEKYYESYFI